MFSQETVGDVFTRCDDGDDDGNRKALTTDKVNEQDVVAILNKLVWMCVDLELTEKINNRMNMILGSPVQDLENEIKNLDDDITSDNDMFTEDKNLIPEVISSILNSLEDSKTNFEVELLIGKVVAEVEVEVDRKIVKNTLLDVVNKVEIFEDISRLVEELKNIILEDELKTCCSTILEEILKSVEENEKNQPNIDIVKLKISQIINQIEISEEVNELVLELKNKTAENELKTSSSFILDEIIKKIEENEKTKQNIEVKNDEKNKTFNFDWENENSQDSSIDYSPTIDQDSQILKECSQMTVILSSDDEKNSQTTISLSSDDDVLILEDLQLGDDKFASTTCNEFTDSAINNTPAEIENDETQPEEIDRQIEQDLLLNSNLSEDWDLIEKIEENSVNAWDEEKLTAQDNKIIDVTFVDEEEFEDSLQNVPCTETEKEEKKHKRKTEMGNPGCSYWDEENEFGRSPLLKRTHFEEESVVPNMVDICTSTEESENFYEDPAKQLKPQNPNSSQITDPIPQRSILRLGLSRKQRVKPLHNYLKKN